MKSCSQCGFSNDPSMRFCLECGTKLGSEPRMVIPLGRRESRSAGVREDETVVAPRTSNEPRKKRSYVKIVVGLFIAGILLVVVAAGGIITAIGLSIYNNPPVVRPKPRPTPRRIVEPRKPNTPPHPGRIEISRRPTRRATFRVYSNRNWQVSNIRTVESESFRVRASGRYRLSGINRRTRAKGVQGHTSRRIYKQFPTGALLMRTHLPDGGHSNIQAVSSGEYWENYEDERGLLEFIVNDNAPEKNRGSLRVRFEMQKD